MTSRKEEPNTPRINAWPEGHNDDRVTQVKRRRSLEPNSNDKNGYDWYALWERSEFYVFLLVGGGLWYWIVFRLLDWHRFPYHSYMVEVCFIVAVPILLLAFLLAVMDRTFGVTQTKKKD